MNAADIAFRPITPEDTEFLYTVYARTRTEELAAVPWTEAQKEAFLRSQFDAQHRDYQANYRDADFLVILLKGVPIGRLYIGRGEREIRIIDIALLPEHRNAGIGGAILKDILAEAERGGKKVGIHVEMFNPALALYERLGFRKLRDLGVYHYMEWSPESSA
jgi:ribosomal protein S18 acetylase RimI-like enzyme